MRIRLLLVILGTIAYTPVAYADVRWKEYPSQTDALDCRSYVPYIHGDITNDDVKKLAGYLSEIQNRVGSERWSDCRHNGPSGMRGMVIWLNSRGGEINAALAIGRMVRRNNMTAVVPKDAECSSSCVLILGGAVVKYAFGRIGVHRPYFGSLDPTTNYSSLRKKREDMLDHIRTYLREVDVSLTLVEMMEATPPEHMRYLTDTEVGEVRLHGQDAAFNERTTAEEASIYGMSSLVYRQRVAEANEKCANKVVSQLSLCWDSILLGSSSDGASKYLDYLAECMRSQGGYVSNKKTRECRIRAVQKVKSGL